MSANAVSLAGLLLGSAAALCFYHWRSPAAVVSGLLLAIAWMIADGLDGMVARATATASAFGRMMDGLCDHGVFILLYAALAWSVGTSEGWGLAIAAGVAHAVQASLYEGERARYHRRVKGVAATSAPAGQNALVRLYDMVAGSLDRAGAPLEALLRTSDAEAAAAQYGARSAGPMRLMALLTANVRVWIMTLACLAGRPELFWWAVLIPLSLIAAAAIIWHRIVERKIVRLFHSGTAALGKV